MNTKILIVGQAPANQKQQYPYDTTQLYNWLTEIGVTKEKAQELFIFDAVYDKFPGFDSKGGHLKPTKEQMDEYWSRSLSKTVDSVDKILLLGNVSKSYFAGKEIKNKEIYTLIHPSTRNIGIYNKNKDYILNVLKKIVKINNEF